MCRDKVLTWIVMELDISWQKLVFMDRKLLPASARCRRYSRYVAFFAICWNIYFIQSLWKQDNLLKTLAPSTV